MMKTLMWFAIGFISCALIFYSFNNLLGKEIPLRRGIIEFNSVTPADRVSENDILIFPDKIVLNIRNASISRYAATGSMKPVLDEKANGIRIVPKSADEIEVGDVISFKSGGKLIVHRVIKKGVDSKGIYFVTKGDSNLIDDGKVRFKNIKYVTIGVLW